MRRRGFSLPAGVHGACPIARALLLPLAAMSCNSALPTTSDPCEPLREACAPGDCLCKVKDPIEHCIRVEGCRDDRDCPGGSVCLARGDAATAELSPLHHDRCVDPTGEGRCVIASHRFDDALIDGFLVNELPLEPVADTSAFSFSPPPDAFFVACALFGCRPDVRMVSTDIEGNPLGGIVNFTLCSLSGEAQVFDVARRGAQASETFSFTPSVNINLLCKQEEDVCTEVPAEGALPTRKRQLSLLGVGCWAYDDTHLIAATHLVPVPLSRISTLANMEQVLSNCSLPGDADNDKSCHLGESEPALLDPPPFGTCSRGECLARCITAADCPFAVATKDCPHPLPTCDHDVSGAPQGGSSPSFVGVCRYSVCDRNDTVEQDAPP